jgi:predicted dehydrogenase
MKARPTHPSDLSRRQFLGHSARNAAGAAAGMVALSSTPAVADQTDSVRVGIIGVRNQGKNLAERLAQMTGAEIAALCDVDSSLESAARKAVGEHQESAPLWHEDFRRVLDDTSIDAVVIATPDHWHAIIGVLACQAGKDVYLEKPVSHTVEEGQRLVEAANKHNCVMQTGLQQRSGSHFQSAVETVRSGKLGTVKFARAWIANARRPMKPKKDESAPAGVNYDLWLGPAPQRAFNANRFHHHWRSYQDYGTGELGNWGVHLLDIARWGLDVGLPERVSASGGNYVFNQNAETPDTMIATFDYPEHTITWEHRLWSNHGVEGRGSGVAFHGEKGTLVIDRSGWKVYDSRERLTADASELTNSHLQNFLDCIRTRETPAADIETGHKSTMLCHLGNIAWQLGREVRFDADSQSFASDDEANSLLTKSYRGEWTLPTLS